MMVFLIFIPGGSHILPPCAAVCRVRHIGAADTHPVTILTIFTSPMVAVLMPVALMVLVTAPMVPMATVLTVPMAPMVPVAIFVPVLSVIAKELPMTSHRITYATLFFPC